MAPLPLDGAAARATSASSAGCAELAEQAVAQAADSMTLLDDNTATLPLDREALVLVTGPNAARLGDALRDAGAMVTTLETLQSPSTAERALAAAPRRTA